MNRRIFITVGEVSGDQHAGNLIRQMLAIDPTLQIEGIGGAAMKAAGATIHHETVTRAAMGWKAMLRYFELSKVLKWTKALFAQSPPDLMICIDSWAMNWHFARLAHEHHVPVLYYISPQVWASRAGRIVKLRQYVDRVACILPFEEEYFRQHDVPATFVGHPLFDALPEDSQRDPLKYYPNRPPVIGLLPGSRSSVAKENLPNLLDVAQRISAQYPKAIFAIPTLANTDNAVRAIVDKHLVKLGRSDESELPPWANQPGLQRSGRFIVGFEKFDQLVPCCDLCITVSGTASLHVAGHCTPVIVVYRLNPILWHLAARWIVKTRTYSLVNLLNDSHQKIVPEYIPWYGSNAPVANKAIEYLHNPLLLDEQRTKLRHLMGNLNRPGASRNAAHLALELLTAREKTIVPQT